MRKHNIITLLALALVLTVLACNGVMAATYSNLSGTVSAIWGDTSVQQDFPGTNYGAAEILKVLEAAATDWESYVLLNLSFFKGSSTRNLTEMKLKLYVTKVPTGSFILTTYCNDSFNESNLTWNNKGTEVINCQWVRTETVATFPINQWHWFNFSGGYINSFIGNDYIWAIKINGSAMTVDLQLASKENTNVSILPYVIYFYDSNYNDSLPNVVYNPIVLEYSNQPFSLNFSYNNSEISSITANLIYAGTTYTATSTNNSNWFNFTKTINIPAVSETYNETKSFYWAYDVFYTGGENQTYETSSYYQTIHRLRLQNNMINAAPALNFTIKDEKTSSYVNATALSSWTIWAIGNSKATQSRDYDWSNGASTQHNYSIYPPWQNATTEYYITLANSSYGTRIYTATINISNSTATQTFYMLKNEDGSYVAVQVINVANEPLSNVQITAEKNIIGTWTLVQQGATDSSGVYQFFLDPTALHRFNFTRTDYNFYTTQIIPTQPTYTVTLTQSGTAEQSYNRGINYTLFPTNQTLLNNTVYPFTFNVKSSYYSLQECGFTLTNLSGTVLGSASDTDTTNCYAPTSVNTGNNSQLTMNYYWKINDTYMNGTWSWYVKYSYKGEYSIAVLIDDIRNFADNRIGGFDDFGLMLIVFLIIFILTAKLAYESGIYSPLAILGFITACVFFADYCNLLPHVGNIPYFTTIMIGIIWIAYVIHEYA